MFEQLGPGYRSLRPLFHFSLVSFDLKSRGWISKTTGMSVVDRKKTSSAQFAALPLVKPVVWFVHSVVNWHSHNKCILLLNQPNDQIWFTRFEPAEFDAYHHPGGGWRLKVHWDYWSIEKPGGTIFAFLFYTVYQSTLIILSNLH